MWPALFGLPLKMIGMHRTHSDLTCVWTFPFVRTDRPEHSRRNLNVLFDQHYPARSDKLYIAGTKEMVSQQKPIGKSLFHRQNDWPGHGPAGHFLTFGKRPLSLNFITRVLTIYHVNHVYTKHNVGAKAF